MTTQIRDLPGEWPLGRPVPAVQVLGSRALQRELSQTQTAIHRALRAVEDIPRLDVDGFGEAASQRFSHLGAVAKRRIDDLTEALRRELEPKGSASYVVPPGARVAE